MCRDFPDFSGGTSQAHVDGAIMAVLHYHPMLALGALDKDHPNADWVLCPQYPIQLFFGVSNSPESVLKGEPLW